MDPGPEVAVLLASARMRFDPGARGDAIAAIERNPVWDEVLRLAAQHAITPILYRGLTDLGASVPRDVLDRLTDRAEGIRVRNLEQAAELLRVLDRFEAAGIEAMPYKGPVLAGWVYGDLALREFVDLDILLRPEDVRRAVRLLVDDGYQPPRRLTRRRERHLMRTGHDSKLIRDPSVVELQWAIAERSYPLPRDLEPLFRRRTRVALGGREVDTLSREDTLLILCVHGGMHFWERLGWICDVAETLRAWPDLDVSLLRRRAHGAGALRMLLLGLEMARRLVGVGPPPALVGEGRDRDAAEALARDLEPVVLGGSPQPEPEGRSQLALRLRMRDRPADRARETLRLLTTPTVSDWEAVPLPDALWPAYYPIRLGRLAWAYGVRRRRPGEGID